MGNNLRGVIKWAAEVTCVKSASGSAVVPFAPVRVSICDTGFMGLVKRAFIVV